MALKTVSFLCKKYNMKQGIYILQKEDLLNAVKTVLNELKKFNHEVEDHLDDRLKLSDAAKFMGVTSATIVNWKNKKLIPYYQIGNKVFFSKKQLIEVAHKNKKLLK